MPSASTAENMEPTNEITTAPPDITEIIQNAIRGMGLATSEEMQVIAGRVEKVEAIVAELPATYASREDVRRVVASQEDYEMSRRLLTKQVADLANVQADIQPKFASIESRLNELSGMKTTVDNMRAALNTFTENITVFMTTQRERLDNHDTRLINNDRFVRELAGDVRFVKTTQEDAERRFITDYSPVRDFIVGSETQKPLMVTIDNIQAAQTTQGQTLQTVADYVRAQQQKEADRLSFWRSVRLQMWTWRGVLSMLLAVLVVLIIANSINFDQLFDRIRQLADAIGVLFSTVKVG